MKILSSEGIKINVTLIFSEAQALLTARVGATYVSPIIGRLDYVGEPGMIYLTFLQFTILIPKLLPQAQEFRYMWLRWQRHEHTLPQCRIKLLLK